MFEDSPLQRAFAVCNTCGELISDDRPGIGVWHPDSTAGPDADVDVTFVHKGACDIKAAPSSLEISRITASLFMSSATPSQKSLLRAELAPPTEGQS